MRFAEVLGHARPIDTLQRMILADRIGPGILFHGPEGVGKRLTAKALVSRLECQSPEGADSCGRCAACRAIDEGRFPDLHLVEPDKGEIRINMVRELQSRLNFEPIVGPWKTVLVDEAHTMNLEAANALLKTLEEPRGKTTFVLVTAYPDRLPETILSRCVRISFGRLANDQVVACLLRAGVDESIAREAARVSRGSAGKALLAVELGVVEEREQLIREFLRLAEAPYHERIDFAASVARANRRTELYLDVLRSVLEDLVLVVVGVRQEGLANPEFREELEAFARCVGMTRILAMEKVIRELDLKADFRPDVRAALEALIAQL